MALVTPSLPRPLTSRDVDRALRVRRHLEDARRHASALPAPDGAIIETLLSETYRALVPKLVSIAERYEAERERRR